MKIQRFAEAQVFYKRYGFKHIDVPWIADKDICLLTAPENVTLYPIDNKYLVASAEQSFLQLLKDGKSLSGKYQTITPCFRDDKIDFLHQRYFTKLELFDSDINCSMLECCLDFFKDFLPCEILKTERGHDIISSKSRIELGSYGARDTIYGKYYYGTGLAEPRLSRVLQYEFNN